MDYQTSRQHRSQATRKAILDAAVRLTKEGGFDKLNIRDVCAAAGVTTGAFYHHFSSKEDLLTQGFSSLDAYLEEAMGPYASAPPLERLEALVRSYAAYTEDMGWQTMALYYTRRLSDPASAASLSPNRYTLRTMEACLRALSAEQVLTPERTPAWTAEFFFRHFRGVVVDWILHQGGYPLWPKLEQDYALFEAAFRA